MMNLKEAILILASKMPKLNTKGYMEVAEKAIYWALGIMLGGIVIIALLPTILSVFTGGSFNWSNITIATNSSGSVTNSINLGVLPTILVLVIVFAAIVMLLKLAQHKAG